ITKVGRSHKFFDNLIKEINSIKDDNDKTEINTFRYDYWSFAGKQPKRAFDSVLIPESSLNKITKTLEEFVNSEQWYVERGIPYQLGILLYGPPGTGKTSLIRAIAAYMDRSICMVPSGSMANM